MMPFLGCDNRTPQYVNTAYNATNSNQLDIYYPTDSVGGDLIVSHISVENRIAPNVPDGWTVVYSNTNTAAEGPSSGRALLSGIRGAEDHVTVNTSGGGSVICTALRYFNNIVNPNTEFAIGNTSNGTTFTYSVANTRQAFLIMLSHDGGNTPSPTLNISTTIGAPSARGNLIWSYNNTFPYRAMAMAYVNDVATSNTANAFISKDRAYGVYFYVNATY